MDDITTKKKVFLVVINVVTACVIVFTAFYIYPLAVRKSEKNARAELAVAEEVTVEDVSKDEAEPKTESSEETVPITFTPDSIKLQKFTEEQVFRGETLEVELRLLKPGSKVYVVIPRDDESFKRIGELTVNNDGMAVGMVTISKKTVPGMYQLYALSESPSGEKLPSTNI